MTRLRKNKRNLKDTYPEGELTAFQSRGLVAPESAKYFRTADGSWNNLENPREGSGLNAKVTCPPSIDIDQTLHPPVSEAEPPRVPNTVADRTNGAISRSARSRSNPPNPPPAAGGRGPADSAGGRDA